MIKNLRAPATIFKTLPHKIRLRDDKCVPRSVLLYPSDIRTVINVLDKCVRKISTFYKYSESNTQKDKSRTAPLFGQSPRNNISIIGKTIKKDIDMFVSKCNEEKSNYIQQANVKFCADGIRSRQKIDDIQTTVEQPKQKLTGQYSCEFTTETSINLVKGNVRYLLGEYDKSPKSPEKLDNNLSELKTVINVFDVCVRNFLKEKVSPINKRQTNQLSRDSGPFDLPPI